jgi:hypothetical protein
MITLKEILQNPKQCRLPIELNLKWAVITSLLDKVNNHNFDDVATYVGRFSVEFKILFFRMALIRKPDLREHPEFPKHIAAMGTKGAEALANALNFKKP